MMLHLRPSHSNCLDKTFITFRLYVCSNYVYYCYRSVRIIVLKVLILIWPHGQLKSSYFYHIWRWYDKRFGVIWVCLKFSFFKSAHDASIFLPTLIFRKISSWNFISMYFYIQISSLWFTIILNGMEVIGFLTPKMAF